MRVQIDEARRYMQSRRIDRPVGVAGIDMPDSHDDVILDADVAAVTRNSRPVKISARY